MNAEGTAQDSFPSSLMGLLPNSSLSALTTNSITSTPHSNSPFSVSSQSTHNSINSSNSAQPIEWPPATPMNYPGVQIRVPFNRELGYPLQYMPNPYNYGPANNTFTVGSVFPCAPVVQQPYSSRFVPLAPKPVDIHVPKPASSHGPPDFIKTIKQIRACLYEMAEVDESDEPPIEGNVYSRWRKSVIEAGKPNKMDHYIMVAKLSNRCFSLVLKIAESRDKKVTQSDFLDLYNKSEEKQHQLLLELFQGRRTFDDLKKCRRGESSKKSEAADYKEMAEEISRLRQRNADLKMKLEQVIEDRDNERKKAKDLTLELRRLKKENQEEYDQYRMDVSKLVAEKNHLLSESLTNIEHIDTDEEELSPSEVVENRIREKRGKHGKNSSKNVSGIRRGQHPTHAFETKINQKLTSSHLQSSDDELNSEAGFDHVVEENRSYHDSSDSDNDNIPLSKVAKATDIIDDSDEEAKDSDNSSFSEHFRGQIMTKTEKARLEQQGHRKDHIQKTTKQKNKVMGKVQEVKKRTLQPKPKHSKAVTSKKIKHSAPSLGQNKKDRDQDTDDDFVDEWDYNLETIQKDDWVAVAYCSCDTYYVGQVEDKAQNTVRVNFLIKRNQFFYWPTRSDRQDVHPKFIVCPKVKVEYLKRKYRVFEEEKIFKTFKAFSKKYL